MVEVGVDGTKGKKGFVGANSDFSNNQTVESALKPLAKIMMVMKKREKQKFGIASGLIDIHEAFSFRIQACTVLNVDHDADGVLKLKINEFLRYVNGT